RVALVEEYLQFNGSDTSSPFLTEMVAKSAVKGPSYRDARDRLYSLLVYQAMRQGRIRREVLKIEPRRLENKTKHTKDVDALFLEVDGLHVHQQNSTRSTPEVKLGVVHEGWKRKHPSSEEYELRNKSYWYSLEDGENFWEL